MNNAATYDLNEIISDVSKLWNGVIETGPAACFKIQRFACNV